MQCAPGFHLILGDRGEFEFEAQRPLRCASPQFLLGHLLNLLRHVLLEVVPQQGLSGASTVQIPELNQHLVAKTVDILMSCARHFYPLPFFRNEKSNSELNSYYAC